MSTVEHIENILSAGRLPRFRLEKSGGHYRVVVGRKIVTHFSDFYPNKEDAAEVMAKLNKRYHGADYEQ